MNQVQVQTCVITDKVECLNCIGHENQGSNLYVYIVTPLFYNGNAQSSKKYA